MLRSARICLVLLLAVTVCGCPELQKLRRDNKELNDKLAMARQQIKDLEEQNALMRQDNDQLKTKLLTPPAKAAGAARKHNMGPGVDVRTQGDKTDWYTSRGEAGVLQNPSPYCRSPLGTNAPPETVRRAAQASLDQARITCSSNAHTAQTTRPEAGPTAI